MTEMLTAKDMQSLLQVDRSTIYRMAEAGQLPAIKVGKQWRFPGDQVDSWLNNQNTAAPPPPSPKPDSPSPEGFASLLPLRCVQLIQDAFAEALEIMIVTTDMTGKPVTEVSNPCGLFGAISQTPDAVQKCVESWHNLAESIELEPNFMVSHLGLLCARGLIRVGTELKGMVIVGGIAPRHWPPSPEEVASIAATFEVEPELLTAHMEEVFHLEETEQKRILGFVQRIANIVSHIANERYILTGKLESIAKIAG